eukprot:COSAG05_NODE_4454_length_1508_cov_1.616749_2_plen_195_part_00
MQLFHNAPLDGADADRGAHMCYPDDTPLNITLRNGYLQQPCQRFVMGGGDSHRWKANSCMWDGGTTGEARGNLHAYQHFYTVRYGMAQSHRMQHHPMSKTLLCNFLLLILVREQHTFLRARRLYDCTCSTSSYLTSRYCSRTTVSSTTCRSIDRSTCTRSAIQQPLYSCIVHAQLYSTEYSRSVVTTDDGRRAG